jgi:hypothetical protein
MMFKRLLAFFVLSLCSTWSMAITVQPGKDGRADFDTSFEPGSPEMVDFGIAFSSDAPLSPGASVTIIVFNSDGDAVGASEHTNTGKTPLLGCACLPANTVSLKDDFYLKVMSTKTVNITGMIAQYRAGGVVSTTPGTLSEYVESDIGYDWDSLPLNEWVRVTGPDLDPVPIIDNVLLAAGIDGNTNDGSIQGSLDSWVSGAADEGGGKYYVAYGGGHRGSWLNGVWKFDVELMKWSVEAMPSDPNDPANPWTQEYWDAPNWTTYLPEEATPKSDMLPDGMPTARHTYDATVWDSTREIVNVGTPSRWVYDPDTGETYSVAWNRADSGEEVQGTSSSSLIYDDVTDKIYGSLNILSDSYVWIEADPATGEFVDLRKPIRKTPLCTVKAGREIIALGGANGLQWAHFNMDTKNWQSGDIADLPAHNWSQEMQVCVYVPEWNKVIRQFTRDTMRNTWYLYDPVTKTHEVYEPAGDVPLGRLPGRYAFYYPSGASLVYLKLGQEGAEPSYNGVHVMRIGDPPAQTCGIKLGQPECPRATVTYKPTFPPLGDYSVPGVCEAIHDESATQVTLQEGELLKDALLRMRADPTYDSNVGGIINLPWDVKIQECDFLDYNYNLPDQGGITVRGIPGPKGELPRLYCRYDSQDNGTIPQGARATVALQFQLGKVLTTGSKALVENVHVDGYNRGINCGMKHCVLRNVYVHHSIDNGIASGDFHDRFEDTTFEVCGIEASHNGRSDRHNFYMHRNNTLGFKSTFTLVDSKSHSCNGCSSVKSIANENYILNNHIQTTRVTDPSFPEKRSVKLLDIIMCAQNQVSGNTFDAYKPTTKGGVDVLAFRNRRNIFGCDEPEPAWEGAYDNPTKILDAVTNDPAWWTAQNGAIQFRTDFFNNRVNVTGQYADQWYAIQAMGTYPNRVWVQLKNPTCLLEAPATWYERSKIYVSNNTYTGNWAGLYENRPPYHWSDYCPPLPSGPGPGDDMFVIGDGEVGP